MNEPIESSMDSRWISLRDDYFGNRPIIIAANRAPVVFDYSPDGELSFNRGAGGLVTALSALVQYFPAVWVACARTQADVDWGEGEIELDGGHNIHVHFINPSSESYEGYYNVIANPLLWFLQHSMWDLPRNPVINKQTWEAWEHGYKAVNQRFSRAIIKITKAAEQRPLVMLQDYHLYLVSTYIDEALSREQMPTIMHFTHIPWPGPEYWRILPPTMRQELLEGMCKMDLLGFQTKDDSLNFIRTIETYLPRAATNYKRQRIWYRNHATHVRDFPISIDVEGLRTLTASEEVAAYREEIERSTQSCSLIVRVDRIDPSKNIKRGFQAFEEMLVLHPEHCGKVQFLAILVPSRLDVDEYREALNELMAVVGRVNANFGEGDWEPIRVIINENYPKALAALQSYDVLLVNSIADGMNLVAKEGPAINQRDGVLILSERTGARQQLGPGALVIAPCDIYATAEAIHQALKMPDEEKHENAKLLRWIIEREDITLWLIEQLQTIQKLNL
jgi:trehalose 6-phosphate synthase